ncbi:MAG: serine protease [Solirubrobacteraceae bacterium]
MRRRLAVLVVSACPIAFAAQPAEAIVGGGPAAPGEYPYVANVSIGGAGGCSGSLVAPKWVVTAGHCVTALGPVGIPSQATLPPSEFTLTLGTTKADGSADDTGSAEEHTVTSVHVDPNYAASNGTGSDVGLLELTEASKITPVKIAAPSEMPIWEPGDTLTIAGFGVTEEGGDAPTRLQEATVPRVSDPACSEAYSNTTPVLGNAFDPATSLCAGLPEGGRDTCQGDSGGPLLAPLGGGFRLVGDTSFGEGCAREGLPGVYGRLAEGSVKDFITRFVPEAYATGSESDPISESGATCAGTAGLAVVVRGKRVRKVVVSIAGKRVASRRRAGRIDLAARLPRTGTTVAKVTVIRKNGKRRVLRRTFTNCARA